MLARAFVGQPAVDDFAHTVPAGVSAFEVKAGAEPQSYYEYLLELISVLSGGSLVPDFLERSQAEHGFEIRKDLLQHLSGRRECLVFTDSTDRDPQARSSQNDEEDDDADGLPRVSRAYLLELKQSFAQEARVRKAMKECLADLAKLLKSAGLDVDGPEVAGASGDFYVVDTGPLLGRQFYFGTAGSQLVVATSRESFSRASRAAVNDGTTILEDASFQKVWKKPEGKLDCVSYGNFDGDLDGIRTFLTIMGALARSLPDEGEAGFFKPALLVLPRFRETVKSLDFLDNRSSYTLRDGSSYRGRGTVSLKN